MARGDNIKVEDVDAVCKMMAEEGLTRKEACLLVGLNPKTVDNRVAGQNPDVPWMKEKFAAAKAAFIRLWLRRLGEAKSMSDVQKAKHMLYCSGETRFRDDKRGAQAGVRVEIIQGQPGTVRLGEAEVEVIEGGEAKLLEAAGENS